MRKLIWMETGHAVRAAQIARDPEPRRSQSRFPPVDTEERTPEWMPDNSMDRKVAAARAEMGEARWNALNEEWETQR